MQAQIRQWWNKLQYVGDVFAIGQAVEAGRLNATQASSALDSAVHRSDVRAFENLRSARPAARREEELVDAR